MGVRQGATAYSFFLSEVAHKFLNVSQSNFVHRLNFFYFKQIFDLSGYIFTILCGLFDANFLSENLEKHLVLFSSVFYLNIDVLNYFRFVTSWIKGGILSKGWVVNVDLTGWGTAHLSRKLSKHNQKLLKINFTIGAKLSKNNLCRSHINLVFLHPKHFIFLQKLQKWLQAHFAISLLFYSVLLKNLF